MCGEPVALLFHEEREIRRSGRETENHRKVVSDVFRLLSDLYRFMKSLSSEGLFLMPAYMKKRLGGSFRAGLFVKLCVCVKQDVEKEWENEEKK